MADAIPNDLIPADQVQQGDIPTDLVPVGQGPAPAPVASVSSAIPNDLVPAGQTQASQVPQPLFDQRRAEDVQDTNPEKQSYLTPQDIADQNSAYADMYSAGQGRVDSLAAAQAIKAKYPWLQNANVAAIKAYIDHYRAGGRTFPLFQEMGGNGLTVSKKQDPVSTTQQVAGGVADALTGLGEGFEAPADAIRKSLIRGVAALQGGDAPDKAEQFISDMEDTYNNQYENPTGWSRFGGKLLGSGVSYAPAMGVTPFAELGPIGQFADTAVQGAGIGALDSGGKDVGSNTALGALTGAGLHTVVSGIGAGLGLVGAKVPDTLAAHLNGDGSFAGLKRAVFGTDNPKVTAQTFEPEFVNPQAPYSATRAQHLENIKAAVDDVTKGWENSPDFNIIGSARNLTNAQRAEIRQGGAKSGDVESWVGKDGRVNIIANNIDDPSRIPAVLYHEVSGHIGLKKQFGDGLDDLLQRIYDTNWRARQYADNYTADNPNVYQNDPSGAHIRATEEYLASQQEQGPQTQNNWEKVKQYVRDFGRNRLGMDLRYNDNDVKNILQQAHTAATGDAGRVQLDGGRFMYTGPKGASNAGETSSLQTAQTMDEGLGDAGRDGEIRSQTGWFRGPDGKWRQEISDSGSSLNKRGIGSLLLGQSTKLPDLLNHPELYRRYPHLEDTNVLPVSESERATGTRGIFDPQTGSIHVDPTRDDLHSSLLHEIQHSIQGEEGFSRGGNPETALNRYPYETLAKGVQKFIDHYQAAADHWNAAKTVVDEAKELPSFKAAREYSSLYNDAVDSGDYNASSRHYDNAILAKQKFWRDFGYKGRIGYDAHPSFEGLSDETIRAIINDLRDGIDYGRDHFNGASYKAQNSLDHVTHDVPDLEDALKTGNKKDLVDAAQSILAKDTGYEAYQNLLGEIEARDTQARQHLTDEERLGTKPYSTFDFAKDHVGLGGEGSVDPSYSKAPAIKPDQDNTHVDAISDDDYTGTYHPVNIRNPETGEVVSAGRAYVNPETGEYQGSTLMHPLTKEVHTVDPETSQIIQSKIPPYDLQDETGARFSLRRSGKESLTRTGQDIASAVRDENRTSQSWEETFRRAEEAGLTPGKLFKKKVIDAKPETAAAIAGVVDDLVNKTSALEERVARGEGTSRDIQMQASALARAVRALEIYEGHKSDIGRSLNILGALKDVPYDQLKDIDVGRLSDPEYVQAVTFKLNEYKNNPQARAMILRGVSQKLPEDVLTSMHYDLMLSGLGTQSRNIFGQTTNLLTDMLVSKPVGKVLGEAGNVVKAITGAGEKSETMSMKEYAARWGGIVRALTDLGTWKQTAQSFEEMHPISKSDQQYDIQTKNPIPYMDYSRRTLSAVDNLMHSIMVNSDYYGMAVRDGLNKGLKGSQLADHIDQLVHNPTPEMVKNANTYASDLSLIGKSDGPLARAIGAITKTPNQDEYLRRGLRFLVMNTIPWMRVPANAVRTMLESNILTTWLSRNTQAAFGPEGSSIARQTAISKALMGTALGAYFMKQYEDGNLRRNPVTFGLEYKSGGMWHSMRGMDPLIAVAAPAMSMSDAIKGAKDKDPAQAFAGILNGFSGAIMTEGFGTQLSDLIDAMTPGNTGAMKRLMMNQSKTLVPALGRDLTHAYDPVVRDTTATYTGKDRNGKPQQKADWTQEIINNMKTSVPGLSSTLPAKLDNNGQPIARHENITGILDQTPVDTDPVDTEVDRLTKVLGKSVVNRVKNLSPQEQGPAGQRAHDIVSSMIASPTWSRIPDDKKAQLISKQYANARAAYRKVDKAQTRASAIPSDLIPAN